MGGREEWAAQQPGTASGTHAATAAQAGQVSWVKSLGERRQGKTEGWSDVAKVRAEGIRKGGKSGEEKILRRREGECSASW